MNQNYIAQSAPQWPDQRAYQADQRAYPADQMSPIWYGWPPPWYGAAPAYIPQPPAPPETPGGVRKLAYSVEEAAEALGVSRSLVYRLIHQRGFPSVKLRGRRLISIELLAEWIRTQAGGMEGGVYK